MKVFEGRDGIVVYVEKRTANHPVRPDTGVEGQREWFRDLENSGDQTGRRVKARWWEFWRWPLFGR